MKEAALWLLVVVIAGCGRLSDDPDSRTGQPSQRVGSPFHERNAINATLSPSQSPKPCNGYWLSFRNNGDIPRDVAIHTTSTNHPCHVTASL